MCVQQGCQYHRGFIGKSRVQAPLHTLRVPDRASTTHYAHYTLAHRAPLFAYNSPVILTVTLPGGVIFATRPVKYYHFRNCTFPFFSKTRYDTMMLAIHEMLTFQYENKHFLLCGACAPSSTSLCVTLSGHNFADIHDVFLMVFFLASLGLNFEHLLKYRYLQGGNCILQNHVFQILPRSCVLQHFF